MFFLPHPLGWRHAHKLFKRGTERTIATESALQCQFLGCVGTIVGDSIFVESHEMLKTQPVDVRVVVNALLREQCTQVGSVGASGGTQCANGQVVLQV